MADIRTCEVEGTLATVRVLKLCMLIDVRKVLHLGLDYMS